MLETGLNRKGICIMEVHESSEGRSEGFKIVGLEKFMQLRKSLLCTGSAKFVMFCDPIREVTQKDGVLSGLINRSNEVSPGVVSSDSEKRLKRKPSAREKTPPVAPRDGNGGARKSHWRHLAKLPLAPGGGNMRSGAKDETSLANTRRGIASPPRFCFMY